MTFLDFLHNSIRNTLLFCAVQETLCNSVCKGNSWKSVIVLTDVQSCSCKEVLCISVYCHVFQFIDPLFGLLYSIKRCMILVQDWKFWDRCVDDWLCRWAGIKEADRAAWWSTIHCGNCYAAQTVSLRKHWALLCTARPVCPISDCFNTRVCSSAVTCLCIFV